MGFEKLTDILKKAQAHYPGFSKRYREAEAMGRWTLAVGPTIDKHSRAIRIQDEVLWVEVEHPIWKSELQHRKRQILDILNRQPEAPPSSPKNAIIHDILFLDPRKEYRRPIGESKP